VIVRADLPRGIQAAQIIHAAGESSPGKLPDGTFAIALSVPDEAALVRECDRLRGRGFVEQPPSAELTEPPEPPSFWQRCLRWLRQLWAGASAPPQEQSLSFVPIREPDPPYHGALMAIGIVPARREALRRHLSSLPKLK
jgi:hypothetical protein